MALMPAQVYFEQKPGASGKQSEKVFEEGKVTMGMNKGSQQREDTGHPLSPGRHLFTAVDVLLLDYGSTFWKSLSGIMNNHGLVKVKQH
jgi:hypothetical protein